jgi:hypothetical protein
MVICCPGYLLPRCLLAALPELDIRGLPSDKILPAKVTRAYA